MDISRAIVGGSARWPRAEKEKLGDFTGLAAAVLNEEPIQQDPEHLSNWILLPSPARSF